MLDHPRATPASDSLSLPCKLAGLEPGAARPRNGVVYDSPVLGRMQFFELPGGVASFWCATQPIAGTPFALQITCQVEGQQFPGAGHEARLVALRRSQAQETAAARTLINAGLRDLRLPYVVSAADLVLTSIHLPPRPLFDARDERIYRCTSAPVLSFALTFVLGTPISAYIDRG